MQSVTPSLLFVSAVCDSFDALPGPSSESEGTKVCARAYVCKRVYLKACKKGRSK